MAAEAVACKIIDAISNAFLFMHALIELLVDGCVDAIICASICSMNYLSHQFIFAYISLLMLMHLISQLNKVASQLVGT